MPESTKAMSYDRMKKKEKDLRSQIKDLLTQAEAADAEEDAATPVPDPCDTLTAQENDPPGTKQTHAIAVNQQLRHHPRFVTRLATLLTAVHLIHRRKIELIDHVADDIRQMILRSDTWPISNLAWIGHLNLLRDQFREVWIPRAVESELQNIPEPTVQMTVDAALPTDG